MAKVLFLLVIYFTLLEFYEFVNVECEFNMCDFWNMKNKYRCAVKNILNIDSFENAQINEISGTHMSGKSNDDEIYFNASNKSVNYFPRGLEKFFTNMRGIAIWYDSLKEIHQSDLKPYSKLEYLNIYDTKIEIIEDGIFNYNPNLEVIVLGKSNIFHVGLTVFDHLTKLTSLYMLDTKCINLNSQKDRTGVLNIINTVKSKCMSDEFLKLDQKFKNLKNDSNFVQQLSDYETELKASKFANFLPLYAKLQELKVDNARNSRKLILTETYQNCNEIANSPPQINETLKELHSSIYDIKTSQADILSLMDYKLSTTSEQLDKFDDKFTELEAKIESLSNKLEDVETRIFEKMEEILEANIKKIFRNLKFEV
ncbi:uncharacterized protein [Chironomus tepperi]|uniref:uncharacterized protein n=1 Tax=Chironomus tepperi TaxID=113505 RepID=UPI00391F96CA